MEDGYADTGTLEIATRACVSKRKPCALVGNKQEMLAACIKTRAKRLRVPADLPHRATESPSRAHWRCWATAPARDTRSPAIAVFRLAIAEAMRAPEVARALDAIGGETRRDA
jgi:AcrR family transcriptional regulator